MYCFKMMGEDMVSLSCSFGHHGYRSILKQVVRKNIVVLVYHTAEEKLQPNNNTTNFLLVGTHFNLGQREWITRVVNATIF
jgi:hypothetical protein